MKAPVPTKQIAAIVVRLNDPADLNAFIAGLKLAAVNAKTSGAIHSAFAHQKDGTLFQVEVQFPTRHA